MTLCPLPQPPVVASYRSLPTLVLFRFPGRRSLTPRVAFALVVVSVWLLASRCQQWHAIYVTAMELTLKTPRGKLKLMRGRRV
jgi:hypothetical protein